MAYISSILVNSDRKKKFNKIAELDRLSASLLRSVVPVQVRLLSNLKKKIKIYKNSIFKYITIRVGDPIGNGGSL